MFDRPWNLIGNFIIFTAAGRVAGSALGFILVMIGGFCLQGQAQTDFVYGVMIGGPIFMVLAFVVWGICIAVQHHRDWKLIRARRIATGVDPIRGF